MITCGLRWWVWHPSRATRFLRPIPLHFPMFCQSRAVLEVTLCAHWYLNVTPGVTAAVRTRKLWKIMEIPCLHTMLWMTNSKSGNEKNHVTLSSERWYCRWPSRLALVCARTSAGTMPWMVNSLNLVLYVSKRPASTLWIQMAWCWSTTILANV